jgi:hypothetical protein
MARITRIFRSSLFLLFLSSCAAMLASGETYDFTSPPSSSGTALIEVYRLQKSFGGPIIEPKVLSVDGKDVDAMGKSLFRKTIFGTENRNSLQFDYTIRLSPGPHILEVKYNFRDGPISWYSRDAVRVTVAVETGKHYDLMIGNPRFVTESCRSSGCPGTWDTWLQERQPGVEPPRHVGII